MLPLCRAALVPATATVAALASVSVAALAPGHAPFPPPPLPVVSFLFVRLFLGFSFLCTIAVHLIASRSLQLAGTDLPDTLLMLNVGVSRGSVYAVELVVKIV